MPYTIIIPIHNEENNLPKLLNELVQYCDENELLFIDDGSTDNSSALLKDCQFIKVISLENNSGKGVAIRTGIQKAKYNKILITDGDLELNTSEITKLMILDKEKRLECVFGSRYDHIQPFETLWEFGNFFLTGLFNFVNGSQMTDALCCAKAFFKNDVDSNEIKSTGFDIDVELATMLLKKIKNINVIYLTYTRRSSSQGKKLRFKDGWLIMKRIFLT